MRIRSSDQEDYLLRLIREAAETVKRLRELLVQGAVHGEPIRMEARTAIAGLLGREAPILVHLDAVTAVRLLSSPSRVAQWVELLEVEAEACALSGAPAEARALRLRANDLRGAQQAADATGGS